MGGLKVGELVAYLKLDDTGFTAGMAKAKTGFASFSSDLLAGVAKLAAGFAVVLVGGLAMAAKSAMKFQQSMEMIHTQAGASQAEVKSMT
ncbi:MAG: hypothetical protein ACREOS_04140, partial [Candidatus Dormibacteraceae bacterium]